MDSHPPDPQVPGQDLSARRVMDELRDALGGDFEVVRALGRGSVASVYLATDRVLGVPVAIKILRPEKASDETARRRFEREARAAASLADHPHTVAVTRFGRLPDQTPYLVMQYVRGRTLEERVKAEGRLSLAEGTRVLREVASALESAHAKGIVHRDVRPGNVMWDEERSISRLTDFGIAAVVSHSAAETTRLTKTGQLLGDPQYLSPEQLLDEELTELADIYMFGLMGYEILTGEGPYQARSATEWITAHINKEPRHLRTIRPDAPAFLEDLLLRCLAKNPRHRPTARDVVRALDQLGGTGAVAGTAGDQHDLQTLVKKRVPQIVLVTAGAGVTLIGLADAVEDLLPPDAKLLTVIFVVAAFMAAMVIAWFHGEKGRQKAPSIEYVLLGFIALGWLVASALAVLS